MNDKMKILGACVLILGGVGIWVPQLPGMFGKSESSSARAPLPAEGAGIPGMPVNGAAYDSSPNDAPAVSGSSPTEPGDENDPLARIEALLLDGAKNKDDGLAELAMSWQDSARTADPQPEVSDEGKDFTESEAASEEDPGREQPEPIPFASNGGSFGSTFSETSTEVVLDPFEAFLVEYPLSGLILGEKRQLASFGPYTLEVGDFIPGTQAKLRRIERRSVIVSRNRKEFSISLPPFRSNSAPSEDQLPGAMPSDDGSDSTSIPSPTPVQSNSPQPVAATGGNQ